MMKMAGEAPTAPPLAQWTRLMDGQEPQAPAPRSGHAVALLVPSQSVLLFGGSNGKVFFDDFYVLEPAQYASMEPSPSGGRQAKQRAKAKMRRAHNASERLSQQSQSQSQSQLSQQSQTATTGDDDGRPPTLVWKKLVVSIAPNKTGSAVYDATFLASSFGSDASNESPRGVVPKPGVTTPGSGKKRASAAGAPIVARDPHLGSGRDYHTMHYVASPDETQLGLRVLVVGNVVVSLDDDDDEQHGRGASQQPPVFDMEEMRVDEVRVKQPQLTAQWVPRTVKSMWKPRARNGHCSALLGDQLFCFGGKNAALSVFYNDFFYFDVGLNQWREQASSGTIPTPRAFADMAASATHEQLFVYGGHDRKRQYGGMFMYDVRASRWDKIQSLGEKPETRVNHSLTQLSSNHLVLFGGRKSTSRRNDVFLYDIAATSWKQVVAQTSRRRHHADASQSESQAVTHQPNQSIVPTQSSVASAVGTTPKNYPSSRTAHTAILFEAPYRGKTKKLIVFGGYAGSHTWLNDLHVLNVDPIVALAQGKPGESELSTSSTELTVTRGLASSASSSSQSTARSSSRSSIEGALLDITNLASSQQSTAGGGGATTEVAAPPTGTTTYTPAAVAARRRRLAEMESKRDSPRTTQKKKQRPNESTECTSASQSQALSESQSQAREQTAASAPLQSSIPGMSAVEDVGLQTTMIQLLQHQQRMDHNITRLSTAVREGQSLAHRDAVTTHQVFMQKQNENLEHKLDAMTKRYEAMEKKAHVLEHDKQALQEQLVAAETEIYVYKKNVEDMIPQLSARVLDAVEKATRTQTNSSHMVEAKLSSIHDVLEEMRHFAGERTETDDSPPKKSSIFLEDSLSPEGSQRRTHTPAALYPQTVVRDLENKLHDVAQENSSLHQRIAVLEDKLKKAEGNAQRIQELSMSWLRYQQEEEEVKGE